MKLSLVSNLFKWYHLFVHVLENMKRDVAVDIWIALFIGAIASVGLKFVVCFFRENKKCAERDLQRRMEANRLKAEVRSAASAIYYDKGQMENLTAQAQQGDAAAQFKLASVYLGMEDEAVGMHWLREAASRHNPDAIRMLGSIEARKREVESFLNYMHEQDLADEQRRENDRVIKELDKRAEARRNYHSLTDQIVKDLFH